MEAPLSTNPMLVGIAGGSGSGKSTLAAALAQELGNRCHHIQIDDFYRDLSHLASAEREGQDFDAPSAIDWATLLTALRSFRQNQPAFIPQYCFTTHTRKPDFRRLGPRPVILVEGLWAFRFSDLQSIYKRTIFVTCPIETRLRRRLERDLESRGRNSESVRRRFLDQVVKAEERYVSPQQQRADLTVRSPFPTSIIAEILEGILRPDSGIPGASRSDLPPVSEDIGCSSHKHVEKS